MIIKWRAIAGCADIDRIECTRENDRFVFGDAGDGRTWCARKVTGEFAFCDTWAAAHSLLLAHAKSEALALRRHLELVDATVAKLNEMTAPAEVTK